MKSFAERSNPFGKTDQQRDYLIMRKRFLYFNIFRIVSCVMLFIGFLTATIVLSVTGKDRYNFLFLPIFFGILTVAAGIMLFILLQGHIIIDEKGVSVKSIVKKGCKHLNWEEIVEVEVIDINFMKRLYFFTSYLSPYEKWRVKSNDKKVIMIMRNSKKMKNTIRQYYPHEIKES